MQDVFESAAPFIQPLNINGLQGRMMIAPATRDIDREILFIYGHHAMLERWWTLVETLRDYGNVTMPDLPGFGGMQSFHKIGKKPTVDNFADYLAAFIKLRFKRKKISIYAISYGFVVVTRMLQKYPELAGRVEILVNVVGYMHHDDLRWSPKTQMVYRAIARTLAARPIPFILRHVFATKFVVVTLTQILPHSKHRFVEVTPEEFKATMNYEVKLWQINDLRTHWYTTSQFFTLDNTKKHIDLDIIHVVSANDHYLNNVKVEQHIRQVFKGYKAVTMHSEAHTPPITADKKANSVMVPPELKRILSRLSNK